MDSPTAKLKGLAEPGERERNMIRKAIARHSYCTLATSSAANRPLVAGVLYVVVGETLFVSTLRSSAKARNIGENERVALCIPVRRFPVGPPFSLQFQARAEILAVDDPQITEPHAAGRLKKITSHGELDDPDACMLRITPGLRVATYGLGVSLREILRDPLHASRSWRMARP